jgi:hypothetical protein
MECTRLPMGDPITCRATACTFAHAAHTECARTVDTPPAVTALRARIQEQPALCLSGRDYSFAPNDVFCLRLATQPLHAC